ncbi:YfgM family protein [Pseudomaricurvus sp.]|uniref:YfgM family protein n=1 Tax=Pseudomaricurvus sp. TaxID=2004510 RepID=UPI003F6AC57D
MTAHLTEEEQLESMKRWWDDNGKSTIVGIALAIGGYVGWGFWQDTQQENAEAASAIYQNLSEAMVTEPGKPLSEEKATTANHLADELKEKHSSSLYASQAALFKAKMDVENGDLDAAAAELQWVIDQNVDESLTLLVRSRLARVQLDQKLYEQALATVADENSGSFKATFAEIRGDVFVSQNEIAKALAAYQLALDNLLPEQATRRPLLEIKLEDLQPSVASTDQGGDS